MAKNIYVEHIKEVPLPLRKIEIVERKGIGHPDSVADALAEEMSKALCRMYKKEVGHVLHHNTDETQIVAGLSNAKFGGGKIIDPSYILLVGRATTNLEDPKSGKILESLPCKPVALKAARDYLSKTFKTLNVDTDIILDAKLGVGSTDLRGVFDASKIPANDTSFGVGYAPYSTTEKVVLETEQYINGKLKSELPEAGYDVKVMGSRVKDELTLTIACAMVDQFIPDKGHYQAAMEHLHDKVYQKAMDVIGDEGLKLKLDINTGDDYKRGVYYLTHTGLSQENGDDGSVGRGNRANGLIIPYRPMSMEATSGKNPITHIGKIYNIMSLLIANDIAKKVSPEVEVRVRILSQIGKPVSNPLNCSVQLVTNERSPSLKTWQKEAKAIAAEWLDNVPKVTDLIIEGKVRTF